MVVYGKFKCFKSAYFVLLAVIYYTAAVWYQLNLVLGASCCYLQSSFFFIDIVVVSLCSFLEGVVESVSRASFILLASRYCYVYSFSSGKAVSAYCYFVIYQWISVEFLLCRS